MGFFRARLAAGNRVRRLRNFGKGDFIVADWLAANGRA
jgi:hypothetical protein